MIPGAVVSLLIGLVWGFAAVALASEKKLSGFRNFDKQTVENELRAILYSDNEDRHHEAKFFKALHDHHLTILRRRFPRLYCMPTFIGWSVQYNRGMIFGRLEGRLALYTTLVCFGPGLLLGFLTHRIPLVIRLDLSPPDMGD